MQFVSGKWGMGVRLEKRTLNYYFFGFVLTMGAKPEIFQRPEKSDRKVDHEGESQSHGIEILLAWRCYLDYAEYKCSKDAGRVPCVSAPMNHLQRYQGYKRR